LVVNQNLYFLLESVNTKQTEVNKMRRSISALLAGLMLGSALLSACAPASTAIPEVVKETVPVQQTVVVTQVARPTEAHSAIPGSIQINSAGATFPLPLYTEWTYAYQYVDPAVAINYQGIGSGGGKGNPGVAAAVQNTPNSLGYVELDYALVKKIAYT
jgi:ABC-type phosphate transport system substrate-binding protein